MCVKKQLSCNLVLFVVGLYFFLRSVIYTYNKTQKTTGTSTSAHLDPPNIRPLRHKMPSALGAASPPPGAAAAPGELRAVPKDGRLLQGLKKEKRKGVDSRGLQPHP